MATNFKVFAGTAASPSPIITKEDKQQHMAHLIAKSNWRTTTQQLTLEQTLVHIDLVCIRTDNLTVLDFDTDDSFKAALDLNDSLVPQHQSQLITRSLRKGGHIYYRLDPEIELPIGHTKQSIVDIQSGPKTCIVPPSKVELGKVIHYKGDLDNLTILPPAMLYYLNNIVISNIPEVSRKQILRGDGNRWSDDAVAFVDAYLSNNITQDAFNTFYNLPDLIPAGQSNEVYITLSTRLASDETINIDKYVSAMIKYNQYTQRKTQQELKTEVMDRMTNNTNGLWRFVPDKLKTTYTVEDKRTRTKVSTYQISNNQKYIMERSTAEGEIIYTELPNKSTWLDVMEKIATANLAALKANVKNILLVNDVVNNYSLLGGYNQTLNVYNKAFHNSYLNAFNGSKPTNYQHPQRLITMMEEMWSDEFTYLMDTTKYRYSTFKFSPVTTMFKGTEGSGKDLSVHLLTVGFNAPPQQVNYQLMSDKHSNWQIQENAIFTELGDWKQMEKDDVLAAMKTISGSNGNVSLRGMNAMAATTPTIVKIWHTSNNWVKLHSDPVTQRRVHVVSMPIPLEKDSGGKYSKLDIEQIIDNELLNFYHYLGNHYTYSDTWQESHYNNARCRQGSESYQLYKESVQSKADQIAELLYTCEYDNIVKALEIHGKELDDLVWKISRDTLVITKKSLTAAFANMKNAAVIEKNIDRVWEDKSDRKRLKFEGQNVEAFIRVFGQPKDLGHHVAPIPQTTSIDI